MSATEHAALAAVEAAWSAAATPWNADALGSLYTEDAVFFGGRPGHSIGRPAVRAYFASYEGVIESATLQIAQPQFHPITPDCLLVQGYADFRFVLAGGETSRSTLRATWLIARQPGNDTAPWRIRQHHFSTSPTSPPLRGSTQP